VWEFYYRKIRARCGMLGGFFIMGVVGVDMPLMRSL
jgi:hypothetical protein